MSSLTPKIDFEGVELFFQFMILSKGGAVNLKITLHQINYPTRRYLQTHTKYQKGH